MFVGTEVRSTAFLGGGEETHRDGDESGGQSVTNFLRRKSRAFVNGVAGVASSSSSAAVVDTDEAELDARMEAARESSVTGAALKLQGVSPTSMATAFSNARESMRIAREGNAGIMQRERDAATNSSVGQLRAAAAAAGKIKSRQLKRGESIIQPRSVQLADTVSRRHTQTRMMNAQAKFLAIVTHAMDAKVRTLPPCVCSHTDSKGLMVWDVLVSVLVIYAVLLSPLEIAFSPVVTTVAALTSSDETFFAIPPLVWMLINAFITVVWAIDIVVRFRVTYIRTLDGHVESRTSAIARRYLHRHFATDLFATVPWEILLFLQLWRNPTSALLARAPKIMRVLRLPRLLKAARFYGVWRKCNPSRLAKIRYSWLRTLSAMLVVVIVVHWMACGFFLLHEVQGDDQERSWVAKIDDISETSTWRLEELYVASMYWSVMTLTTIGYGDIAPENTGERIYTICTMFVGAVLFSFILSEIATLLESVRWRTSAFKARIDSVSAYMERKMLPTWLRRKCMDFLFEAHERKAMGTLAGWGLPSGIGVEARCPNGYTLGTGGGVEGALLWLFSPYLRNMIGFQLFAPYFTRTPAFAALSPDFLGRLSMELIPTSYGQREYIYVVGDAARSMFFLASGCVLTALSVSSDPLRLTLIPALPRSFSLFSLSFFSPGRRVQREVWSEDDTVSNIALFTTPECFGQEGAITLQAVGVRSYERPRLQSVRTLTFCDAYVLPRAALAQLCSAYPSVRRVVKTYAVKRAWRWLFRLMVRAHQEFFDELHALAGAHLAEVFDDADASLVENAILERSLQSARRRRSSIASRMTHLSPHMQSSEAGVDGNASPNSHNERAGKVRRLSMLGVDPVSNVGELGGVGEGQGSGRAGRGRRKSLLEGLLNTGSADMDVTDGGAVTTGDNGAVVGVTGAIAAVHRRLSIRFSPPPSPRGEVVASLPSQTKASLTGGVVGRC